MAPYPRAAQDCPGENFIAFKTSVGDNFDRYRMPSKSLVKPRRLIVAELFGLGIPIYSLAPLKYIMTSSIALDS